MCIAVRNGQSNKNPIKIKANTQEVRQHNARIEQFAQQSNQLQEAFMMEEKKRITGAEAVPVDPDKEHISDFFAEDRKRKEQLEELKKQEEGPIISPAKQVNAEDVKFEGAGSPKMNLSFQAGG